MNIIGIVTRNRPAALHRLLSGLEPLRATTTLLILNQGSKDGLEDLWPRTQIIHSPFNRGCGGGRQRLVDMLFGAGLSDMDTVTFLDDDIQIERPDWHTRLIAPIQSNIADIVGVAGQKLTGNGMTIPNQENPDFVSGGWCAIKGQVFLSGVEFDPQFTPNYYEDADFQSQARAKGFRVMAIDNPGLFHPQPAFTEPAQSNLEANRLRFIAKWEVVHA